MPDLEVLLARTSRTFALSIPELPEPTRRAITLAYLLFRVADTFEDATTWTRRERVEALDDFVRLLKEQSPGAARDLATRLLLKPPCAHEGYLELLGELPGVMDSLRALSPETVDVLVRHLARTAEGMAEYVNRGEPDGSLRLRDLDDLRHYCYVVAGIVGELITDTFLLHEPGLLAVGETLREHARAFGEGLQLVNILRDSADDAKEGRVYLPEAVELRDVFCLARNGLRRATLYVHTLQQAGAPRGYVGFTALPVLLAFATLDRVESVGAGAKVSRQEVHALVEQLHTALDQGQPAIPKTVHGG